MTITSVAVIGGTGALGSGLAYRFAKAGFTVWIGSRSAEKAKSAAGELKVRLPEAQVEGGDYAGAAASAGLVIIAVPFAAQAEAMAAVKSASAGKIVIDTTVALKPPKVGTVQLPPEGSAGCIARNILGADALLVSAFQNIAAGHLDSDHAVDCDVLVCSDHAAAAEQVVEIAGRIGLRAFLAGPLANSAAVEGLTSILITLNRKYKSPGAGIRLTNIPGY
jgi:NADPH-dependent F420 reductase